MSYGMGMATGALEPYDNHSAVDSGISDQALDRRHPRDLQQALATVSRSCVF